MPTEGELAYYDAIGQTCATAASQKPFSEANCGYALMQVGAVFSLLPPPPARILECGCGAGWLTLLFAQHGYECVGVDVAPKAIELARALPAAGPAPEFAVADAESMAFDEEFDAVVFYDALHHSIDEAVAIQNAYRALRPEGVCITSEPGLGHNASSAAVVERYGVTEKDMPATYIVELGRAAGFRDADVYPRFDDIGRYFMAAVPALRRRSARAYRPWWKRLVRLLLARLLGLRRGGRLADPLMVNFGRSISAIRRERDTGIVALYK